MHECIESLVHHDDTPVLRIPTMISFGRARSSARQSTGLLTPAALLLRAETRWPRVQIPSSPLMPRPAGGGIDAPCRSALMSCPSDSGIDGTRFRRFPLRHDSVEGFK